MYGPRFWSIVGLLLVFATLGNAKSCASMESEWLIRERVHFEIAGPRAVAYAASGATRSKNSVSWTVTSFVEREKSIKTLSGSTPIEYDNIAPIRDPARGYAMFESGEDFLDPLEYDSNSPCTGETSLPCGKILGVFEVGQLDCQSTRTKDMLEGIPREMIVIHITDPDQPDFRLNISYVLLDADLDTYHTSQGNSQLISYRQNTLKIFMEFENFPWQDPDQPVEYVYHAVDNIHSNNASWIGFWLNVSVTMETDTMARLVQTSTNLSLSLQSIPTTDLNGVSSPPPFPYSLSVSFSEEYFLDGHLYEGPTQRSTDRSLNTSLATVAFNVAKSLAPADVGHFRHLWYDPTLSATFSGIIDDPATPGSKKNSKTVAIAVGVSLGSVALIVLIMIIVVVTVPSVRNFFRPFERREKEQRKAKEASRGSKGWKQSVTPSE